MRSSASHYGDVLRRDDEGSTSVVNNVNVGLRADTRRQASALRSRNSAYRFRCALPRRDLLAFGRSAASSSSIAWAAAVSRASSISPLAPAMRTRYREAPAEPRAKLLAL